MGQDSGDQGRDIRQHRLNRRVAVAGVVATVVAALIGAYGTAHSSTTIQLFGGAGSPSPSPSPYPSPSPSPSPSPVPPSAASAEVFHNGTVSLALNGAADLDSPASDPTWGVVSLPQGQQADIRWQGGGLFLQSSAQGFVTKTADSTTCQKSSAYGTNFIDLQDARIGTFICVYTSEQRFAQLKMTRFAGNDGATFTATTYKRSDD